jgi:Protein of unknown function (DUF3667)
MGSCENCGMPLSGPYCSACGQRVLPHGLSLKEFLGDAAEAITHADSRFWRTFVPLLVRPGFLTQQFIQGRRANFLPPFRLYLVLSVVFFLVIPLTASQPNDPANSPAEVSAQAQVRAALQKELGDTADPKEKAALQKQLQRYDAAGNTLAVARTGDGPDCSVVSTAGSISPWLRERVVSACKSVEADQGRELGLRMLHNLGRAMFVLLPLLAALMLLLYRRQRRHYVEHLLLLLHNHAFVFLALTVLMIATHFIVSDAWAGRLGTALSIYMIFYLYQSMRCVYGQGWAKTLLKFCALGFAYLVCAALMFALTTIYSAATL